MKEETRKDAMTHERSRSLLSSTHEKAMTHERSRSLLSPTHEETIMAMLRRVQKRGEKQGREFWGCSDYPKCNGTRPI